MTHDQLQRRKAVRRINQALKDRRVGEYVQPPAEVVRSDQYKKLTRHQIDQAVIAFILAANISGGSVGSMDFYKLARAYLWDEEVREKVNSVVSDHGF
jgi:predicted membrane-bound spermidine synthase